MLWLPFSYNNLINYFPYLNLKINLSVFWLLHWFSELKPYLMSLCLVYKAASALRECEKSTQWFCSLHFGDVNMQLSWGLLLFLCLLGCEEVWEPASPLTGIPHSQACCSICQAGLVFWVFWGTWVAHEHWMIGVRWTITVNRSSLVLCQVAAGVMFWTTAIGKVWAIMLGQFC